LPDRAALLGFYRQHLAYCHAVSKLPADGLLWSEAFAG
jgi:hypothetical protein